MSYKLKKHDEVKNETSGMIHTVISTGWGWAKLSNDAEIQTSVRMLERCEIYISKYGKDVYSLHAPYEKPAKLHKPKLGITGQPIVFDGDKEVLNEN